MSRQLINEYRAELDRLRQISGSRRESVLREAFKDLLKRWGKSQDLIFAPEHDIVTPKDNRIYVDGVLLHSLRVPFGHWEAKDESDDLNKEIEAKFRKGYPKENIVFTDDVTAVLWQDGHEIDRAAMDDTDALFRLMSRFFAHERAEIADFKKAVAQFGKDLPDVLNALREMIAEKRAASSDFARAEKAFLDHARDAINPAVSEEDVQEMLIQHILTEDIFAKVFDNPEFHQQNNVAKELYALEGKLFGYGEKTRLLKALAPYYAGIDATASLIESHSEKQGFLKALYENFYKVYNPLAADRLGVVYTPGEIVRFMIRSADWLCEKHFGKNLVDKGVEILDPATGTGTFIVELLEHFRGNHEKLRHKYKEELHANEVAILPYYVANLNIEATYHAITGQFAEYPNLCFVDTLDNVAALGIYAGHQHDMFGGIADENMARVKRQNERKISVIIGNPPYNANQQNENDNNKNRAYARVDERIKQTYIKASTAQKTKLYDMYSRFFRWATDRLNEDGVLAFITNRSFIESRTFDGFRKMVAQDFNEIWVIDLGGDVRANPKLSGTKHNVFGIQTGVAICYLVRKKGLQGCTIRYIRRPEDETAEDKLSWIGGANLQALPLTEVKPNSRQDWLNTESVGGWDEMLPIGDSATKAAVSSSKERSIFKLFAIGVSTNRDEWVFDRSASLLNSKAAELRAGFDNAAKSGIVDGAIKWSRNLKGWLARSKSGTPVDRGTIRQSLYRPFTSRAIYDSNTFVDERGALDRYLPVGENEPIIALTGAPASKPFHLIATPLVPSLDLIEKTKLFPRYRFTKSGERVDNVTDWAVQQFKSHYGDTTSISKDVIFAYCYAVLHDPLYREKYALNLKREFPRIPFYPDFAQWVAWGQALLDLHIGYEKVKPFKLKRTDTPNPKRADGTHPKPKLKSNPETGNIVIDEDTQLSGIPREAWDYRLGNRSGIDWVLDQHKEKTPRDPTIREKFNTYRFADYKESCIDLLAKVVQVSVETVAITEAMKALDRSAWD
ncbi:type ISP restriction/modification enzyme [uncultured Sphingorhabdus sp.]|uniref:type ISP restriction/modification enzyme n=1 Tax=uncultured Sphingorhabdus sp. TaxID=1686106 RepID=UPI0026305163|nr:type ISP restriction/modification enzyme [uncultured Sphingorhabdus sp.]HMS19264.1 N-6 DNA methylase [Sphingorhabdus sp.]